MHGKYLPLIFNCPWTMNLFKTNFFLLPWVSSARKGLHWMINFLSNLFLNYKKVKSLLTNELKIRIEFPCFMDHGDNDPHNTNISIICIQTPHRFRTNFRDWDDLEVLPWPFNF